MTSANAYDEIVTFIAEANPSLVLSFKPSEETNKRVEELIYKEREHNLNAEEKEELEHFLMLEHIMRLSKAKARQLLNPV